MDSHTHSVMPQYPAKNAIQFRYITLMLLSGLVNFCGSAYARTLEPRAYSNAPVGMNFLLTGYQNARGALLFDPSLPVEDASADVDIGLLGYVHTLDVAGKLAKVGVLLPYASIAADGYLDGNFVSRETRGIADPSLYFSINFAGGPALSLKDFKNYQQDTIIGFSVRLTAPLGKYEPDKLINVSTNRWTIEPGLGISKAIGSWTLEGSIAAAIYTNNNDFNGGKTRQQSPVYSSQLHVTYAFANHIWAAISTTYYTGGRTTLNGVKKNDLQQNWRTGFTLALPVNVYHSIKLFASRGIVARTGTNFDVLGIAWQYRWGGGL